MEQGQSFITYTVEADKFEIDTFLAIIDRLTQKDVQPSDEIGDIKRIDDIYKDEWRELVKDTIDILDENKKLSLQEKGLLCLIKH